MSAYQREIQTGTGSALGHVRELAFRVGEFSLLGLPDTEVSSVQSCMARYYGSVSDPAALVPKDNEDEIRAEIRQSAPLTAALGADISRLLQTEYSAIIVRRMHLDRLDIAT